MRGFSARFQDLFGSTKCWNRQPTFHGLDKTPEEASSKKQTKKKKIHQISSQADVGEAVIAVVCMFMYVCMGYLHVEL